jgi:hypothetical protein
VWVVGHLLIIVSDPTCFRDATYNREMTAAATHQASFDVYGLRLRVKGDWPEVLEAVRRDFAWFEHATGDVDAADIEVDLSRVEPDLDSFGDIPSSYVTEQHVVYRADGRTVVDYLGRAVAVLESTRASIQGKDAQAGRRAAFDFLLSRSGDYLDARGLPRIYGLGLTGAQGAVLVLLPRGGGKTTLALQAIGAAGVGFLSEVSPLIDVQGRLHAFPFPLWVRDSSPEAAALPEEYVRRLDGQKTDPRLLELAAFADQIPTEPVPLRHIVLGHRSLGRGSRLEHLPRRAAVPPLFRQSVVGFSLREGLGFLVRRGGARDPAKEERETATSGALRSASAARRARTRLRCCASGVSGAQVWRLDLGRDRAQSWAALEPLF